jgi:TPR repeat protein
MSRRISFPEAATKTKRIVVMEEEDEEIPTEFVCTISQDIMHDAVSVMCGHTFDRPSIQTWLKRHSECPQCRFQLTSKLLKPNYALKSLIDNYLQRRQSQRAAAAAQKDHELAVRIFSEEKARQEWEEAEEAAAESEEAELQQQLEASRREAVRLEAARRESARQDAIRQEAIRQEALRLETMRQEAALYEAARLQQSRSQAAPTRQSDGIQRQSTSQSVGSPSRNQSVQIQPVNNEVNSLLAALHLQQYADIIAIQGIDDLETLASLTDADFDELGVRMGHRNKIRRAILADSSDDEVDEEQVQVAMQSPPRATERRSSLTQPVSPAIEFSTSPIKYTSTGIPGVRPQWVLMIDDALSGKYNLDMLERQYGGPREAQDFWCSAFEYARTRSDDPQWKCVLALCFYWPRGGAPQDRQFAAQLYESAAVSGFPFAQNQLGWCYARGDGVGQDHVIAVEWYRRAAEQGNAAAQCNLGSCYGTGQGVEQNWVTAVQWFRKSAEQGNATAQFNMGARYSSGEGVAVNKERAIEWFRKAAAQGHALAQYNLGLRYAAGSGVMKSQERAEEWLRKAADSGNQQAQDELENLNGCCTLQ